jgi:COP9 signalosome complex subunit 1
MHIISSCPSLAAEAFQLAVQHIHQSRDPSLYQHLMSAYDQASATSEVPLPSAMDLASLDTRWADEMMAKNQAERSKLEVELKTYSNNMIKESIRVRGLFNSCRFPAQLCCCRWGIATSATFTAPLANTQRP